MVERITPKLPGRVKLRREGLFCEPEKE